MSLITQTCERIVAKLTALGSPIAELLEPGLTDQDLQAIETTLPFVFPDSVREMYKWHNGTPLVDGTTFFPYWGFDTIAESLGRYKVLAAPDPDRTWWTDRWFPIFSASDISSVGIVCGDSAQKDGEIVRFEYMLGTEVAHDSLEAMLQTILEAYESGIIFADEELELDYDGKAFARIALKYSPGVKMWEEELSLPDVG